MARCQPKGAKPRHNDIPDWPLAAAARASGLDRLPLKALVASRRATPDTRSGDTQQACRRCRVVGQGWQGLSKVLTAII
jgi:hypothetical protein